jgi:hypothetical protein
VSDSWPRGADWPLLERIDRLGIEQTQ